MKSYNNRLVVLLLLIVLFATNFATINLLYLPNVVHDFTNEMIMPNFLSSKIDVTVIVIGYNRPESLKRALSSLERAVVPTESLNVNLKVCLDGSHKDTYYVARWYRDKKYAKGDKKWFNGKFAIVQRGENYGLAKHIASCWEKPRSNEWALMMEDDVVVSPSIFVAFVEGLQLRGRIKYGRTSIQGIAMHGLRVNQYCWKGYVKRHECKAIHNECKTKNSTDSTLGSLLCPDVSYPTKGIEWIGTQIPSSWGAFYTGHSWRIFQQYYDAWQQLSDAQLTALELPLSMSNEWGSSWKRPFAELMHSLGWTMLYRNAANQKSLTSTTRDGGVHTKKHASAYEKESRCLISLPLEDDRDRDGGGGADDSTATIRGSGGGGAGPAAESVVHLDYCSHPVDNLRELRKRGEAYVRRMSRIYSRTAGDGGGNGNGEGGDDNGKEHPIRSAVRILQGASSSSGGQSGDKGEEGDESSLSAYRPAHAMLDRLSAAEVVLVTTTHEVNREFREFSKQILGQSRVKFVVVAPTPVCVYLRNHEAAHCLPEKQFVGSESHLPVMTKLLQGGLDAAVPGVTRFVGVTNADVVFENLSLIKSLNLAEESGSCMRNCVVVGRRYDVDWTTKEKKLHSVFGMDYFIFNIPGAKYAIKNMPPMVVGRTRWDSFFMGQFALSPHIEVVDVTETLPAVHKMDFKKMRSSHTHADLINHNMATEVFRMGRIDHSNYKTTKHGTVKAYRTTGDVADQFAVHRERYRFDLFIEKATNSKYSSSALFPYVTCFCALLEKPPKQFCESSTLIRHEIDRTETEKAVILPHDSLMSFLPLRGDASFEKIHVTGKSVPHKCCYTKHNLPMHSRPRLAYMHLKEDYRGPFDMHCLRNKKFPFGFDKFK